MDTFKKLHLPWNFGKRYNIMEGKENSYYNTPNSKINHTVENDDEEVQPRRLRRNTSLTKSVRDVVGTLRQKIKTSTKRRMRFKDHDEIASPTRSKITKQKKSKCFSKIPATPKSMKNTIVYREVKLYSPFQIETPPAKTPPGIRTSTRTRAQLHQLETPTRLRREVESLTANMQALATLSPNDLQQRTTRQRGKSPLTNGSFQRTGIRTSLRIQNRQRMETNFL
ncbi:uncharacterized protein LOC133196546 [Saccostrea echinata]|uniref:uncharacterized protein LOC133196546 n=1 Tax=Saccostrea echinata TaxID=191078 RepID=UPI002A81788C|nr:uncharacterized protein LOC133196546 [Saccostrea echinata]